MFQKSAYFSNGMSLFWCCNVSHGYWKITDLHNFVSYIDLARNFTWYLNINHSMFAIGKVVWVCPRDLLAPLHDLRTIWCSKHYRKLIKLVKIHYCCREPKDRGTQPGSIDIFATAPLFIFLFCFPVTARNLDIKIGRSTWLSIRRPFFFQNSWNICIVQKKM